RPLVPEYKLRLACALEVAEDLVVMLMGTPSFDRVAFPGDVGIVAPARIAPPPELIALVVGPENDIGVAVAIDVIDCPARFDGQIVLLDHVSAPPPGVLPIPDQRWRLLPEAEDKVVDAILVQVGNDGPGLLLRLARYRQITIRARERSALGAESGPSDVSLAEHSGGGLVQLFRPPNFFEARQQIVDSEASLFGPAKVLNDAA